MDLIDEYNNEERNAAALVANQFVSIRLEYHTSHADRAQLFWHSVSQPLSIIDRLFYNASHIAGSPFTISPQSIEPASPGEYKLSVAAWNELNISWSCS